MATLGTFSPLTPLTAAELNAIGAYTAYTPTWSFGVVVGNGTNDFAYAQLNDMVHVFGRFVLGSTSAVNGLPTMSLPVNRLNNQLACIGTGSFQDVGSATYMCYPLSNVVNTVLLFSLDTSIAAGREISPNATAPFTWTNGDIIQVNLWYRSA